MSEIVTYMFDQVKDFMDRVVDSYMKGLTQPLSFEEWKCKAYPIMSENPSKFKVTPNEPGKEIRIAPTAIEMLEIIKQHKQELQDIEINAPAEQQDFLKYQIFKEILKPTKVIKLDKPLTVKGTLGGEEKDIPIWFNTTLNGVNVRLGFDNMDSTTPGAIPLSDSPVHMLLGGITGAGKSVALNDIICSLLLEYAPWELSLILADFKIVELSRYANRIPTPHVKIVAATSSTEFALSTFDYIIKEMNARQEVFTACGVQNIKDFRNKFDLCMPRILLIADEFVQMYENIKIAEEKGDDNAQDTKQKINGDISALARLGRSMGVHMLLSSQNMDGVLDDQTAGQFSAGATLAATPQVSTTLIGNDAGASLQGKGKAFVNLNKNNKNSKENVLVRVPYISSDISAEEASNGKLSYLQELLKQMYDTAQSLGYNSVPYFYNEQETLPRKYLYDALAECKEYMQNPDEGDDVSNQIYKEQVFARIPIGREIKYTTENSAALSLRFNKYNNLIINADDTLTKYYISKLVGEMLSYFADSFIIASADEVLLRQLNLESYCQKQGVSVEIDRNAGLPSRYINMVASRQCLLDLQDYITTKNKTGEWNNSLALEFAYNRVEARQKPSFGDLLKFAEDREFNVVTPDLADVLKEAFPDLGESDRGVYIKTIGEYAKLFNTAKLVSKNFTETICAKSFSKIVVWWLGAESFKDFETFESQKRIEAYLAGSSQVGIFNILVPFQHCDKLSRIAYTCNYILEKCSKEFFNAVELPRRININENSFQLHDRQARKNQIVRFYS